MNQLTQFPNWFEVTARKHFETNLSAYATSDNLHFLQIGVYTGDATGWLVENVIDATSDLTDVDTWGGSNETGHAEIDFAAVEKIYDKRFADCKNVIKLKTDSKTFWQTAPTDHYDFIYVDGAHTYDGVLLDASHAWECIKVGGVIAFDDYAWYDDQGKYNIKWATNKFFANKGSKIDYIVEAEQLWIRKVGK